MNSSLVLPPGQILPPLESGEATSTPVGSVTATRARGPSAVSGSTDNSRAAERFNEINTFLDVTGRTLPRAALLCWLLLWRDSRNGIARTAISDMARRAGCDKRTALRAVRTLVERGLVKVIRKGGLGRGLSTYKVTPVSPS